MTTCERRWRFVNPIRASRWSSRDVAHGRARIRRVAALCPDVRSADKMSRMALSDFDVRSLGDLFERWGYPRGNAGRLLRRYYNCGAEGLDGTVVSPTLASRLVKEIGLRSTSVITRREASDGTVKLLVGLGDNAERGTRNVERRVVVPRSSFTSGVRVAHP